MRTNRVGPVIGEVMIVCPRRKARQGSRHIFQVRTKDDVPGGTSMREGRRQSGVMTRARTMDRVRT
jgi:hypothetical protein